MATEIHDLATVFMMGLVGSVHCVVMCGGIAGLLGGQQVSGDKPSGHLFAFHLMYNTGRISSYVLAGILVALLGKGIAWAGQNAGLPDIRQQVIGVLTLFFGAYLLGWTVFLLPLENAGRYLWLRVEPVARRLLPVRTPAQAYVTGMLWGWLPCGMVYVALSWSAVSSSPMRGGLLMAAFGVGTLPAMLGMGLMGIRIRRMLANPSLRVMIGVLVLLYGFYQLTAVGVGTGSHSHH